MLFFCCLSSHFTGSPSLPWMYIIRMQAVVTMESAGVRHTSQPVSDVSEVSSVLTVCFYWFMTWREKLLCTCNRRPTGLHVTLLYALPLLWTDLTYGKIVCMQAADLRKKKQMSPNIFRKWAAQDVSICKFQASLSKSLNAHLFWVQHLIFHP